MTPAERDERKLERIAQVFIRYNRLKDRIVDGDRETRRIKRASRLLYQGQRLMEIRTARFEAPHIAKHGRMP